MQNYFIKYSNKQYFNYVLLYGYENGITQGIEDVQNFHFAVRRNRYVHTYVHRCICRFREFLRLRKAINFVVVGDVLRQGELYLAELLFIFWEKRQQEKWSTPSFPLR